MKKPILFGLLIFSLFLINGCSQPTNNNLINQKSLTFAQKEEICNDIKAWLDYCYGRGIDAKTCGEQMVEKTMRLYKISAEQFKEISGSCKSLTSSESEEYLAHLKHNSLKTATIWTKAGAINGGGTLIKSVDISIPVTVVVLDTQTTSSGGIYYKVRLNDSTIGWVGKPYVK